MRYQTEDGNLTLAATGDNLITRRIAGYTEPDFLKVFQIIRACDARFANLEMLFHDYEGYPAGDTRGTWMRAHPETLDDLKWAGFNLVSIANNHTMDYGVGGLEATIREVRSRGFTFAGAGMNLDEARAPSYLDLPAGRIALLAATSSFPPSAMAGRQRPDIQGRPGVSGLRHRRLFQVPEETFAALSSLRDQLQLKSPRQRRLESGFGPDDEEGLDFAGVEFAPGDGPRVVTEPQEEDIRDICRWIKDAKRQADWVLFSFHAHEEGTDRHFPAEFVSKACRRFIDEGVDVVMGHGPHLMRGVEIYRNRPIIYSAGNFVYQGETLTKLPSGYYERFDLGPEATPADAFDARSGGGHVGRPADPVYWESILPVVRFQGWQLKSVDLHPLVLGFGKARTHRGRPLLAGTEAAEEIIGKVADLSEPFGTEIICENGVGKVRLG